ncbi:hypothetical protein ACIQNU_04335 [Streptomyces sp. NPDC091292]|uniref:hypothetical protein n=1 Tax=Streptomyces sp. NPDC091292 TaxID=3365991 RepID=UPI0038301095
MAVQGDQPTDEAFVGAISIPDKPERTPDAYGSGGGFVGLAPDTAAALVKLADRAANRDEES